MEKSPTVLSDTQDFSLSYALDVIASTSFGLRTKHLASSESEFKRMIQLTVLHSFRPLINRIIHEWFPYLRRFILISARPKPIQDFLFGMIRDIKQYRNENNIVTKDAFQILIEMHEKSKHIDDEDNLVKTEGIPGEFLKKFQLLHFNMIVIAERPSGIFLDNSLTKISPTNHFFLRLV